MHEAAVEWAQLADLQIWLVLNECHRGVKIVQVGAGGKAANMLEVGKVVHGLSV